MTGEELKKVEKFVRLKMNESNDPQHGWDHLERVRKNAITIVKYLNAKDIDLNLMQAACLLHDVPMSMFKHGPALRHWLENLAINIYLPYILETLKISKGESEILFRAIKFHTFSIPYRRLQRGRDIYTKILQDADSLDFFNYEREESFEKAKSKYFSYRLASIFSSKFLKWGRRHLELYLNYPELAKYSWF